MSVSISKVTLDKKGDKQAVSLQKGSQQPQKLHVNFNWSAPAAPARKGLLGGLLGGGAKAEAPDLDLGCMYRLKDGTQGVIQPLGGNFGARDRAPFIFLDKDDRTGGAADGENLYILRPDLVDLVMVFGLIYEGAEDFTSVGGVMTITDPSGQQIEIKLSAPDRQRTFCAVATFRNAGDRIEVTKEERYFRGHKEADQAFGFGFNWVAGSK